MGRLSFGAEILNALVSYSCLVTLIVFVIAVWLYHFRFQHNLAFDNTYISRKMIAYDSKQSPFFRLLPLKGKAEEKNFVNCLSPALSPSEKKSLRNGLLVYIPLVCLTVALIFSDWILFTATDIIRRGNGQTAIQTDTEPMQKTSVKNDGSSISIDFRVPFKEFDHQSPELNTNECCLAKPRQLSTEDWVGPIVVLIVLGLATLLQPYCQRLRVAIASAFYPERQQERIVFLHGEFLRRRKALKVSLPYRIRGRLDENKKTSETLDNGNKIALLLRRLGFIRLCCVLCGRRESSTGAPSSKGSRTCSRHRDCPAFYCGTCWNKLEDCVVCESSDVERPAAVPTK